MCGVWYPYKILIYSSYAADKSLNDILFSSARVVISYLDSAKFDKDIILKSTMSWLCTDRAEMALEFVKVVDTTGPDVGREGGEVIVAFARSKFILRIK